MINPEDLLTIFVLIYSIVLHEVAHGLVAFKFGDKTAFHAGRITLNPLPHIDFLGSIVVPIVSTLSGFGPFGWAKGVPVNSYNLKGKLASFWVSSAGILMNLALAGVSWLVLYSFSAYSILTPTVSFVFFTILYINLALAIFNLMPIPPFDGINIIRGLVPKLRASYLGFEQNPLFMIISILLASKIFHLIYPFIIEKVIHSLSI